MNGKVKGKDSVTKGKEEGGWRRLELDANKELNVGSGVSELNVGNWRNT